MTQREVQKHCRYWQNRLRLKDWHFKVSFVASFDDDRVGDTEFLADTQSAEIYILKTGDDHEQILVHELLHLRFAIVHQDNNPTFEFAIDSTATALVALRRGTK